MHKYTAIILTSRDTNEFDRVYTFYTLEEGLVRVVAKGARKPAARLAGHLEPVTLSEVYVARSKGRGQIVSALTILGFERIKSDFEKLRETLEIFRFIARFFSEGEPDKRIFSLLVSLLRLLDKKEDSQVLIEGFWWQLFDLLGQRPQVASCVHCQKKLMLRDQKYFDIKKGGIICSLCRKKDQELFSISDNQIKLLRLFFSQPLRLLGKIKLAVVELSGLGRIRQNYQKYHFG